MFTPVVSLLLPLLPLPLLLLLLFLFQIKNEFTLLSILLSPFSFTDDDDATHICRNNFNWKLLLCGANTIWCCADEAARRRQTNRTVCRMDGRHIRMAMCTDKITVQKLRQVYQQECDCNTSPNHRRLCVYGIATIQVRCAGHIGAHAIQKGYMCGKIVTIPMLEHARGRQLPVIAIGGRHCCRS